LKHFFLLISVLILFIGRAALAQDAEEESIDEEGGLHLETGREDSEYQLRGPGELTTPEELLEGVGDDEGLEETAPGEEEISLELDLDEQAEGELPPVHPVEPQEEPDLRWLLIPPYYQGIRGESGTRLFFPIFFQNWTAEGQRQVLVPPLYYWSRGPEANRAVDVAFPIFWWLRSPERRTMVVANFYWSRGQESSHTGFAPLLFWGRTEGLRYQVGFPLFWRFVRPDNTGFTLAALWFDRRQEGGRYIRGVFPLVWIGERQGRGFGIGAPLVYHFWNRSEGTTTTVVPPIYAQQFDDGYGFGVAPILFYRERGESRHLTVFPLFHYGSGPENRRLFISPLAWYRRHPDSRMGGVLLYHWSRGPQSTFDGFIPFYLRGTNERLGSRWQYIFPNIFTSSDPVHRRTVVFPIVWDWENRHRSRTTAVLPLYLHHRNETQNSSTTWVAPTFQFTRTPEHFTFNLHPLLYFNFGEARSHQVVFPVFWRFRRPTSTTNIVAPLWWDFQRSTSRFSVFFPVFWRQSSDARNRTLVLNVFYSSGERQGVPYWSFQFWPLFRVARPAPEDIEWDVLLGLFGYGRRGDRRWIDLFWVPVELGGHGEQDGDTLAITPESERPF
jgi:hypothetical protein